MAETSRPWTGQILGDAGPYTFDHWAEVWRTMLQTGSDDGVFDGLLNELEVTGVVSPVSIDTGYALNHGTWYGNDAAVTVAIPTPAGATRIDRIVLRKSWAAQTVRITRVAGTEGGGAPSLTQVDGTTWDIPLAQVSITTLAAITVTDDRDFLLRIPGFGTALQVLRTNAGGTALEWSTPDAVPDQASQAEIEAESDVDKYIPPDLARFIPGAAKAYCTVASDGTLQSNSYNITSAAKDSTGVYTITLDDDFSNTDYVVAALAEVGGGSFRYVSVSDIAVGSFKIRTSDSDPNVFDTPFHVVAFGDQ